MVDHMIVIMWLLSIYENSTLISLHWTNLCIQIYWTKTEHFLYSMVYGWKGKGLVIKMTLMLECMRAMKVLLSKLVVAHIQQNLLCWVSKHHISMPLIQWVGIIHCVLFKKSKTIFILAFFGKICASGPFCSDAIVLETSYSKISSPCSFYHQDNCWLSWDPLLYKLYDLGATADPNSPCW